MASTFQRRPSGRPREDFKAYGNYDTLTEEQTGPQSPHMLSEALGIACIYFLEMVQSQLTTDSLNDHSE